MKIKILLIFLLSHLIFIPSVFGEGFILTCPSNRYGEKPIKFKFSKDKKSSWYLLNDKWTPLKTKQTESYFYLTGLIYTRSCRAKEIDRDKGVSDEPRYLEYSVPILISIDRSTLKMYETVEYGVTNSGCKPPPKHSEGETLRTIENPCTISKIKF